MTEIETEVRTFRRARIDLPYDKATDALLKLAVKEGHTVGDLKWDVRVSDPVLLIFGSGEKKIWLSLDEKTTTVASVEEVEPA